MQVFLLSGHLIELEQAYVTGHHLVSLLSVLGTEPCVARLERESESYRHVALRHELRSLGRFAGLGDVAGKVQVGRILRLPIHEHHGFEDAHGRHALVETTLVDGLLRCGSHLCHRIVQQAAGGLERGLVARETIPLQEAQQGVLSAPDVPSCSLGLRRVVTDEAILQLAGHQLLFGIPDFCQQLGVVVVTIGRHGALHPFPPELRCPAASCLLLRAEGKHQFVGILSHDAFLDALVDAVAHIALQADLRHACLRRALGCYGERDGCHCQQCHYP